MASSGSITVAATPNDDLIFSWSQSSQSIANNTTTISWSLKIVSDAYGRISSTASKDWSVTVNGTTYSGTNKIGIENSSTLTLASGSTTIDHNSDGTKVFSFSFSQEIAITYSGTYIGTKTGSGSGTLNPIARGSGLSASNGTLGTEQTLTVTRQSSSFTHTITYKCGTASGTICTKSSNTSISWTPPVSLAEQAPSANSVAVTLTLTTYNGSTTVSSTSLTISCAIPYTSTFVPVLLPTTSDAMGYASTYGGYIQGQSKLKLDIETYGAYGAWITSVKTVFDGATYTSTSVTSRAIQNSGTLPVAITVTDSRGRTTTTNESITVLPYALPKISALTAYRSDSSGNENASGAYITVKFSTTVYTLSGKNPAVHQLKYKKSSATSYTTVNLSYTSSVANGSYTFAADSSSYDISMVVTDDFRSVTRSVSGASEEKVFSLLKKNGKIVGMAVGKIAEAEGYFDMGWKPRASGGGDCVEEEGESNGWTYRKWSSGVAECWKTLTHSTALSTAWGALYSGTATTRQKYPLVFTTRPTEMVSLQAESYQGLIFPEKDLLGVNTAYETACYNICRPSSITTATNFYINFTVKGKWK